jgi:NAD(P)-dependent dehydrogenase (short-subunit alcohol dehydrogenase family)
MQLANKIALITGGTSGIGLAAAKLFRDEGARVIITGADQARLDAAARQLGSDVLARRSDVRIPAELDAVLGEIRQQFDRLDIVFANAGVGLAAPLEGVTEQQIDEQFGVNFKGIFFTVQKAVPLLVRGGSIVLTKSFLNAVGAPGLSILSATKAAVRSLARSLGAELATRNIRVNAVSPGPISTPFHGKLGLSKKELKEAAAGIEAQIPLRRFGEAAEIATVALFLASDNASFVTGSEFVVDGGLSQFWTRRWRGGWRPVVPATAIYHATGGRLRRQSRQCTRQKGTLHGSSTPTGRVQLQIDPARGHRVEPVPRVPAGGPAGRPCRRAHATWTLRCQGEGAIRCEIDAAQAPGRSNLHGDVRRFLYRSGRSIRLRRCDGLPAWLCNCFARRYPAFPLGEIRRVGDTGHGDRTAWP